MGDGDQKPQVLPARSRLEEKHERPCLNKVEGKKDQLLKAVLQRVTHASHTHTYTCTHVHMDPYI